MFRMLPFMAVPGYAPYCLDSNDPETVDCAFNKRLLREVPKIDRAELRRYARFVREFVRKHFRRVQPLEFEEWLATTTYNEKRKEELREVWRNMRMCRPTKKECQKVKSFIKTESYPVPSEFKHARMINSRCDAFKCWSGPIFKAIENEVFKNKWFIKHVPVPERPALIAGLAKAGMHYFECDYTSFEASMHADFMRVSECELYQYCLGYSDDAKFLTDVICGKNIMKTRHGHRAVCHGRRMSGDMCTSLGNGFNNLMLTLYFADKMGAKINGFVEGDDGLFAVSKLLTAEMYAKLGFIMKIDEVKHPCEASFCGLVMSPALDVMRDPRKFFMTFGWTRSAIYGGHAVMMSLLRAKALSAVYETPQCPIIGAFARRALELTRGFDPRFEQDGYHVVPPSECSLPVYDPSYVTRAAFASRFGISIATQLKVEELVMQDKLDELQHYIPPTPTQSYYASNYVVAI